MGKYSAEPKEEEKLVRFLTTVPTDLVPEWPAFFGRGNPRGSPAGKSWIGEELLRY